MIALQMIKSSADKEKFETVFVPWKNWQASLCRPLLQAWSTRPNRNEEIQRRRGVPSAALLGKENSVR
jgi:hypothetical protein